VVDELVGYANASGGGEFLSNLSRSVQNNPLPITLTGVGLAWLMMRANAPAPAKTGRIGDTDWANDGRVGTSTSFPYAPVGGNALRRVQQTTDEAGRRYSEFTDDTGKRFKAMSDEMGNRAGHFADDAGTLYRGFTDAAGNRISTFLDEAGERLVDAQGWASDTWESASGRLGDLQDSVADRAAGIGRRAVAATGQVQDNASALGRTISDLLRDQPLVGGALAFALGAAIATALPVSPKEDALLGDASDRVKEQGKKMAAETYDESKQQLNEAFEQTRDEAAKVYSTVKDDLAAGTRSESLH
jgi:gas vesicle protein